MTTSLQTGGLEDDNRRHLALPVRFGRRKTDQVGHLVLTSASLQFQGTVDLSTPWCDVARVEHDDRDLVVFLHGTQRTLRFCCQNHDEAVRACVTAGHLAALAQSDPLQPA